MELKIVVVLGLVDPLEVANNILMDIAREWLGGLELVVGGCVEVKDPSGGGDNLIMEQRSMWEHRTGYNCHPRSPFRPGQP